MAKTIKKQYGQCKHLLKMLPKKHQVVADFLKWTQLAKCLRATCLGSEMLSKSTADIKISNQNSLSKLPSPEKISLNLSIIQTRS